MARAFDSTAGSAIPSRGAWRLRIEIGGAVQGVGFRPFVYRLAKMYHLTGWVLNDPGGVVLLHDADDYGAPGAWRATVGALPAILDEVAARGLRPEALRSAAHVQSSGR